MSISNAKRFERLKAAAAELGWECEENVYENPKIREYVLKAPGRCTIRSNRSLGLMENAVAAEKAKRGLK